MAYRYKSETLERLGLKSWINASSWATNWGGNWLDERVMKCMGEAARTFVDIPELMRKTGERIAEVCNVDAAYISSGAGAGIALSVAACMCGTDTRLWKALPDTSGFARNEVPVPVAHWLSYMPQWKATGGRVIPYGQGGFLIRPTLDPPLGHHSQSAWGNDIESTITEKTCCLGYTDSYYVTPGGILPLEELVEVAHSHDLPVIVDAATQVPPASRLWEYADKGADITIFSGGKGIRGPNNTGLVLAKGERGVAIIEALNQFGFPYHSVGRHYKVSKEQVVGLTVATEIFVEEADKCYEQQLKLAKFIKGELEGISGLTVYVVPNDDEFFEHPRRTHVPRVRIEWNAQDMGMTAAELDKFLASGDPPIKIRSQMYGSMSTTNEIRTIDTYMFRDGEPEIVIDRLKEAFSQ